MTAYTEAMADNGQDFFQAIGKIYVVVAVIVILFIGLGIYLYRLDQKISKLEKKHDHE
jgi:hypothetical protein